MGLKISEQIRTYYFYGVSSIADLAYVVYDEAGGSWATGNMAELGSTGIYYVDWTPDAAGVWLFEVTKGTVKDAYVYHVGQGQEADIELLHDVPAADATTDAHVRDVVGKKNDAAVTTAGTTKSLIAYTKGMLALIADLITRVKGLDDIHDDLVTVLADTNELQGDWANDGRLDIILDAILADSAELQADWANDGRLDVIIDAILADTAELQGDWANDGRLDVILDAVLADTGELQNDWVNGGRLDQLLDSTISGIANLIVRAKGLDDIHDDLVLVLAEVANLDGAAMRGTDSAALASSWTAALATALAAYTAVRGVYLDQLDFDLQEAIADLITRTKGLDDIHDDLVTVLADTNMLQTDWVNGGRLDLLIDLILADTAELQGDWTNGGRLDLIIDLILADTAELQADWANDGRLDLILDSLALEATLTAIKGGGWTTETLKAIYDYLVTQFADTVEGKLQVFEKSITSPADNGITTVATVGTQPCVIEGVVIHADAGQTVDMTSCAVEGGLAQAVEFISAATAIQASLNAADKQVSWTGIVRLAVGKLITIDLQGTGATPVDLTVVVTYRACADGGVLS